MKPPTFTMGVPPGVGDVYWCLAKLESFRKLHGIERLTLAIQKTRYDRALEWAGMVDFVDDARYVSFHPDAATLNFGYCSRRSPLDAIMWPNAVVDRGQHLRTWLPQLELNLSFKVKTAPVDRPPGDVVLFVSGPTTPIWFPQITPEWLQALALSLTAAFDRRPLLIGAAWDEGVRAQLGATCDSLIGQTSLAQVAGILERATVVIGVASGMTILANHFRTPCIGFFPDKHHVDFPRTWVAPEAPYWPVFASQLAKLGSQAIAQQAAFLSAGVTGEDPPGAELAIVREAL